MGKKNPSSTVVVMKILDFMDPILFDSRAHDLDVLKVSECFHEKELMYFLRQPVISIASS